LALLQLHQHAVSHYDKALGHAEEYKMERSLWFMRSSGVTTSSRASSPHDHTTPRHARQLPLHRNPLAELVAEQQPRGTRLADPRRTDSCSRGRTYGWPGRMDVPHAPLGTGGTHAHRLSAGRGDG